MRLVLSALGCVVALCACVDAPPQSEPPWPTSAGPITQVSVSPAALAMTVGARFRLRAAEFVVPGQPVESTFVWRSDDTKVVTVDSAGAVTARGVGVAIVTANDRRDSLVQGAAGISVSGLDTRSSP